LTYHPQLGFESGKEQAINLIESQVDIAQCLILIDIVSNDRWHG
jgi:hypothetical protein